MWVALLLIVLFAAALGSVKEPACSCFLQSLLAEEVCLLLVSSITDL